MNSYKLFTDGGSRGNPGPAAIGGQILNGDEQIETFNEYIGSSTNNIAEYSALIKGLTLAAEKNITDIECFLDSELVVKQVLGIYKVKDEKMKILHKQVSDLKSKFKTLKFTHVLRAKNSVADKLVNTALDTASAK